MIKDRTPKEEKELQNIHEMQKYDDSMPHQPVSSYNVMKKTTYVDIELKYSYDENGHRVFQVPEAGQIKEQLCEGWDVDVDEDGPFKIACECKQCKRINRQEAWEYDNGMYAREDLR